MNSILFSVIGFILVIGILVAVHEFGHYWVARRLGVKVLRFSIGFGKPLYIWRSKRKVTNARGSKTEQITEDEVEFVLAAIPLGGYVKMLDEREADVPEQEKHRAFNRQSIAVRSAIVAAGPGINLIFAVFAFWAVLVLGEIGQKPLIGEVAMGSPAAVAGLAEGDEILGINQQALRLGIKCCINLPQLL